MFTIRGSCPTCGAVKLTVQDLTVRVCADDGRASYTFRCPGCRLATSRPATTRMLHLLAIAGVTRAVWHLPAELAEERNGLPICHDDLLDFHDILERADWFEQLSSKIVG